MGSDLLSAADVERITLAGLGPAAIADVLGAAAGRRPDPAELDAAVRASGVVLRRPSPSCPELSSPQHTGVLSTLMAQAW